jgi:hypothetical protein
MDGQEKSPVPGKVKKRNVTIAVATVLIVALFVMGGLIFYFDAYVPDYAVHPVRVATLSAGQMETVLGKNVTAWTSRFSNSTQISTTYNITGNHTLREYVMINSYMVGNSSLASQMYNETFHSIKGTETFLNSTAHAMNGTYRGFTYFTAIFTSGNAFIAAGHYGDYFFYIIGTVGISSTGMTTMMVDEINNISTA